MQGHLKMNIIVALTKQVATSRFPTTVDNSMPQTCHFPSLRLWTMEKRMLDDARFSHGFNETFKVYLTYALTGIYEIRHASRLHHNGGSPVTHIMLSSCVATSITFEPDQQRILRTLTHTFLFTLPRLSPCA